MKLLYKTLNKKSILIIALLIVSTQTALAQFNNVTGPSPVDGITTHTYQYTDGFVHLNREWVAVGGRVVSTWYTKFPDTYYASVTWANGTSGSITFKSNGFTYGSKTVTINPISSVPTVLSNENYIYNITPRIATTSTSTLDNDEMIESVTYFDGLGRPMQSNSIRGGSDNEDIITYIGYDGFGRQAKEYLPYTESINGGAYKTDALSATNSFYDATKYDDDFPGMTTSTINPYSEKAFDLSPLNRVVQQGAPGKDWKLGEGNEIEFDYQTNDTLSVRYYKVSLSFANNTYTPTLVANGGYYNPGELSKTITYDENHSSGTGHSTEEFKDKQGRIVLKRTYADISSVSTAHDTYYVYDDYGNLSYVLPPKVVHDTSISSTELNELCYQYKYDHRNRLVEKKIPGKGTSSDWEEIVYNKLDLPVMTRDPNLKADGKWLVTKYDAFGRVAYTGIKNSTGSRIYWVNAINSNANQFESKVSTGTGYSSTYYTSNATPTSVNEVLTINYYDNYYFNLASGSSETSYSVTPITDVKGLATGSKIKVLGTSDWITTVNYYDDKYRPIYTYSFNDYLDTTDKVKSELDFTGTVLETTTIHARTGFDTIETVDAFDYDHMNRLVEQTQVIDSGSEEVIVQNTYDELGQLVQKGVGGTTAQNRLQEIDYTYNIRGWLKEINDPNASLGNDLFAFRINYNTEDHGGTELYNGNIAETEWKTANDNTLRWYKYGYDDLNRITSGTANSSNYNLTSVGYDKNGNISNLTRRGHINSGATSFGNMDVLVYTYESSSNKLKKVLDNGNDTYGFSDGANLTTEYTYDTNGNMLKDLNKAIGTSSVNGITYNHLNLPLEVKFNNSSSQKINYIYDATGIKLEKKVTSGSTITKTSYAGNYVYEKIGSGSDVLKFFNQPEGYVEPDGSGWDYVYQYKDHLGNIRLSYSDSNNNGAVTSSEILEENNYYPFGLKHKGYNGNVTSTNIALKKTYNGKEFQDELDLNWHDFGWRNYDASIGRWMNIDPLAEKKHEYTTYNYVQNSPIYRIDPDGLTDFTLNKETGEVTQQGDANEEPDRILKTDSEGNIKKKGQGIFGFLTKKSERGKAKVAIGDIEQGILSDGMNLSSNSNMVEVGGEGQPTEAGVESFALKLSNYVGKEVGGAYFSENGVENTTHITIGGYGNNDYTTTRSFGHNLRNYFDNTDDIGRFNIRGFFHTHPSGIGINDSDRLVPSGPDRKTRDNSLRINPTLRFFLLTNPSNGGAFPRKIPYSTGYPLSDRRL